MNLYLRVVFASLWLLLFSTLSAQTVGFSLPIVNNVSTGSLVNLPIKVSNFDSITSIQFVIKWDPLLLQFTSTDQYNLPGLDWQDFGTTNALDSGILRLAWEAPDLETGVTIANGMTIFRLRLKAVGPTNSGSTVIFTESIPTVFEVTQIVNDDIVAYDIDEVNLTQGFVAIGYTVSAGEPSEDDFSINIAPNPFFEKTQVSFDLKIASDVRLSVTDAAGRLILENTMSQLSPGRHGMEIVSPLLREKGTYFLVIQTKTHSCVRQLIVF